MADVTLVSPRAAGFRAVWPGLVLLLVGAVVAWALSLGIPALSPLVMGVIVGAVVANTVTLPEQMAPGVTFGARSLLRVGIVLLGFRLSLGDLAALGSDGLLVVAVVVSATFIGTQAMARVMGVPGDLGLLVATGYSICGASAIAAVDGVIQADEEETAYAVGLVTLCGSLSIAVLPALAGPLGLAGEAFGTWVGGSVHDVGQVVATAAQDSEEAVAAATVVKLTRVVLLAPMIALIAFRRRRQITAAGGQGESAGANHPPLVPLFVVGFLAAILLRSTGVIPESGLDAIKVAEKVFLTIALVGLGMGVRFDRLRRLGGRPLMLGLAAWVLVAGTAYLGTTLTT
ncbi:MAG: YeiH family protein [Acidimicrobiales bacterium]